MKLQVKMQTFPHLYPNLIECTKQTLLKDGVARGLYAGTVPSLAANIGENSVLFAAYGGCQKLVARATGVDKTENLGMFANGLSGFLAAFWSSLVLCPTELVKCRLQVEMKTITIYATFISAFVSLLDNLTFTYKAMRESEALAGRPPPKIGPGKLTGQILRQDGVPGLFRGLTATFIREMPGYFFFFMAYEATRHVLTPAGKTKDEIGALRTVVAGGVAGVTLWTIIFPADVVKSRLQVSGASTPMLTVMTDILKKEGLARYYLNIEKEKNSSKFICLQVVFRSWTHPSPHLPRNWRSLPCL